MCVFVHTQGYMNVNDGAREEIGQLFQVMLCFPPCWGSRVSGCAVQVDCPVMHSLHSTYPSNTGITHACCDSQDLTYLLTLFIGWVYNRGGGGWDRVLFWDPVWLWIQSSACLCFLGTILKVCTTILCTKKQNKKKKYVLLNRSSLDCHAQVAGACIHWVIS